MWVSQSKPHDNQSIFQKSVRYEFSKGTTIKPN